MLLLKLLTVDAQEVAMENESTPVVSKVVDFKSFKEKKTMDRDLARGRKPLYVSHTNGNVSSNKEGASKDGTGADFGDRLVKIRSSLDRINQLMTELKKLSQRSIH
jgi:hypothetical protein